MGARPFQKENMRQNVRRICMQGKLDAAMRRWRFVKIEGIQELKGHFVWPRQRANKANFIYKTHVAISRTIIAFFVTTTTTTTTTSFETFKAQTILRLFARSPSLLRMRSCAKPQSWMESLKMKHAPPNRQNEAVTLEMLPTGYNDWNRPGAVTCVLGLAQRETASALSLTSSHVLVKSRVTFI